MPDETATDSSSRRYDKFHLKKEFMNSLTRDTLVSLLQCFRLISKLRYFHTLVKHAWAERDKMYKAIYLYESITNLASTFIEAIKSFYGETYPTVLAFDIKPEARVILDKYRDRNTNYRNDESFRLYNFLRNKFNFHLYEDFFDKVIVDGESKADLLLAIKRNDQSKEVLFLPHYDFLPNKLADEISRRLVGGELIEWLMETLLKETSEFADTLEFALGTVLENHITVEAQTEL